MLAILQVPLNGTLVDDAMTFFAEREQALADEAMARRGHHLLSGALESAGANGDGSEAGFGLLEAQRAQVAFAVAEPVLAELALGAGHAHLDQGIKGPVND